MVGAACYVVLPSAQVELSMKRQDVSAVVDIVADSKTEVVNLELGVIPAHILRETVETTASIPTSGNFWLDSVSSAGVVTITNLGETRVSIPAGTILATSAGEPILFETVAAAVVPAGSGRSVEATVEAREGFRGSIGNVGAGMINTIFGALAERVSVINLAPVAGGGARSVKVVDAADADRLRASVRLQLQSLAFESMRAKLSENQIIIIESIQVEEERKEWTRVSADIGTMTSELTLTMRAVVSAWRSMNVMAGKWRWSGCGRIWRRARNCLRIRFNTVAGLSRRGGPAGQIRFTAESSATVAAALDIDSLRNRLAGLSLDEAKDLLANSPELSASEPARLKLYPQGLDRMPSLPVRIDLRVKSSA